MALIGSPGDKESTTRPGGQCMHARTVRSTTVVYPIPVYVVRNTVMSVVLAVTSATPYSRTVPTPSHPRFLVLDDDRVHSFRSMGILVCYTSRSTPYILAVLAVLVGVRRVNQHGTAHIPAIAANVLYRTRHALVVVIPSYCTRTNVLDPARTYTYVNENDVVL